eukprot:TRINITY_DN29966_c0_g1_i1.p1 TRINITY_DN29966_c0_g1~~TRINITY_DN29966_c0_g1_i1.p1  ORF type:complete len:557 (+),score=212.02 TRINITY_DN29966_c0_g1_i1:71-1741(+)
MVAAVAEDPSPRRVGMETQQLTLWNRPPPDRVSTPTAVKGKASMLEKETRYQVDMVAGQLQKKVQATTALKSKIEKALEALDTEIALVKRKRVGVLSTLASHRVPFDEMQRRVRVRSRKVNRDQVDDVLVVLSDVSTEMANGSNALQQCGNRLLELLKQMVVVQQILQIDRANKHAAIEVDSQCLSVTQDMLNTSGSSGEDAAFSPVSHSPYPMSPPVGSPGSALRSRGRPEVQYKYNGNGVYTGTKASSYNFSGADQTPRRPHSCSPSIGRTPHYGGAAAASLTFTPSAHVVNDLHQLQKRSTQDPQAWRKNTLARVDEAMALVHDGQQLRKLSQQRTNHATRILRQCEERLRLHTEQQARKSQKASESLIAKHKEADRRLMEIRKAKDLIQNTMREKKLPLEQCVKRLALRKGRPANETVADAAELGLHSQYACMKSGIKVMEAELFKLQKEEHDILLTKKNLEKCLATTEESRDNDFAMLSVETLSQRAGSACGSQGMIMDTMRSDELSQCSLSAPLVPPNRYERKLEGPSGRLIGPSNGILNGTWRPQSSLR